MTRYAVAPEALGRLAVALGQVADDVAWTAAHGREQAWSLGPGASAGVLDAVLGDLDHGRQQLGRWLDDLATAVRAAGAVYAEVEADP
jgi:hypothetical protein